MTRLRIAVISATAIAGGLWVIAVAAIWINVNGQALADDRLTAGFLGLAACIGFKYDKDRQDRKNLGQQLRERVRDEVTERLASAAVASQRAALSQTLPLPRVVR